MKVTSAATFKTYFQEGISTAFDDLTTGDAAVNIATSAGDITIDAQGNDTDIILKGTDGSSDTTFLTIDGSADKDYTGIRNLTLAGDLTVSGDDITMGTNTSGHILVADGTNFNPVAVTDLSAISTVASGDTLLAVDASGGGLKKIARSVLVAGLATSSALNNISEDTTPQLGGNLDMNGADIVTTSNANIDILPNGSGIVNLDGTEVSDGLIELKTGTGSVAKVKFYCESGNAHAQTLQAAPHSAGSSAVLVLPTASGNLIGTGDAGTLPLAAMDIDGGTDIGADLTTSDLIVVDDGAGGTNRKAALSRVITLVNANIEDPTALAIALG